MILGFVLLQNTILYYINAKYIPCGIIVQKSFDMFEILIKPVPGTYYYDKWIPEVAVTCRVSLKEENLPSTLQSSRESESFNSR